jgi:hypothetical protein
MDIEDIIELRAPALFEAHEDDLEALIELAEPYLNPVEEQYDGLRNQGIAFLVCHWITKAETGVSGPVTEEKTGDISVKYAVASTNQDYGSTTWGAEFLGIRRKLSLLPIPVEEEEDA